MFEILCLSRIPSSGNLLVGHIKSEDPKLGFAVEIVAHLCAKACDLSKKERQNLLVLAVPKEKPLCSQQALRISLLSLQGYVLNRKLLQYIYTVCSILLFNIIAVHLGTAKTQKLQN